MPRFSIVAEDADKVGRNSGQVCRRLLPCMRSCSHAESVTSLEGFEPAPRSLKVRDTVLIRELLRLELQHQSKWVHLPCGGR
jgi:uncharacterized membrane-anchored protein